MVSDSDDVKIYNLLKQINQHAGGVVGFELSPFPVIPAKAGI